MTPDPLAGDISNPQSLNRYAYVLNNPTTLTDPLGLSSLNPGNPCSEIGFSDSNASCQQPGCYLGGTWFPASPDCFGAGWPQPPIVGGGGRGGGGSRTVGGDGTTGATGTSTGSRPFPSGGGTALGLMGLPTGLIILDSPWILRVTTWGWPWLIDIGEGAAVAGVAGCEIAEPCGAIGDVIFAGAFVLANRQASKRLVTATVSCTVVDFTDGFDNAIGYVTGTGFGPDKLSAVIDAKRNAGAKAAAQYPGRRVRVRHCQQI